MNERIKELAEQAWDATAVSADFGHPVSFAEKLSELIVKQTIHEMTAQMFYYGIDEANNPSFYKAIDKTKEHFGVE
jgi:hypothetical protein